jgi:hypothetical protein
MRFLKPRAFLITALAMLILATVACGGSVTSMPSGDAISTTLAETLQAVTPLAGPTQSATTAASTTLPSNTPALSTVTSAPLTAAPASSNLPAASRISFAAGATYSVTEGTVQAGQAVYYVAQAAKGQPLIVMLNTPDQNAILSIFGADGNILLSRSEQSTSWQGTLPATQDYYFRITGDATTQHFTLTVNIPARIQFAPGQTEVRLSGQTIGGYNVAYVAYAFGGQKMDVTINTSPDVAALTIWGFSDGQPYARAQNGVTNFSMTLPATQDYIIEVVPQGGNVVSYEVSVKIQ